MTWALVGQIAVLALVLLLVTTVIQKTHWDGKYELARGRKRE